MKSVCVWLCDVFLYDYDRTVVLFSDLPERYRFDMMSKRRGKSGTPRYMQDSSFDCTRFHRRMGEPVGWNGPGQSRKCGARCVCDRRSSSHI